MKDFMLMSVYDKVSIIAVFITAFILFVTALGHYKKWFSIHDYDFYVHFVLGLVLVVAGLMQFLD
jgi:hypothetical protein